jgi:hypothetical protein
VTYNFDPERWYHANRAALDARRDRGELDDDAWREALADLDRRYDEMHARRKTRDVTGRETREVRRWTLGAEQQGTGGARLRPVCRAGLTRTRVSRKFEPRRREGRQAIVEEAKHAQNPRRRIRQAAGHARPPQIEALYSAVLFAL